jgi:DNA repair protein RecN (Recombination protein N)
MLKSLSISNYVIITRTEMTFTPDLNMITGETGAGKSIILGALGLVLGRRADPQALFDPEQKAVIEAVFSDPGKRIEPLLKAAEIDLDPEVIVRREISPNGRSRAFINDTPVTLEVMSEIGSALVDVHQQFDTLEIQQTREQYHILDAFCQIQIESAQYQREFEHYNQLRNKLEEARKRQAEAIKEKDYLTFQLSEFETLPLESRGLAEMEEEFQLQSGAVEIQSSLLEVVEVLNGEESMADAIVSHLRTLGKLAQGNSRLTSFIQRIQDLVDQSHDLGNEIRHFAEELEPNPGRQQELEEKINVINRVMLKHGVRDEAELMQIRVQLEEQLNTWTNLDQTIVRVEEELAQLQASLEKQAKRISKVRIAGAPKLSSLVSEALHDLSMKHAKLEIQVIPSAALHPVGIDDIEFLFAPNLGSEPKPVKKIASGGELSRLNLCLKSAVSDQMQLPTLVFDEIDAGVSGDVAMRMGHKLKTLSTKHQVIMITHSPQIAARAGHHLQVTKSDVDGRSIAIVKALKREERITEIAKMLSSDPPTKAAIQNAKTLIEI